MESEPEGERSNPDDEGSDYERDDIRSKKGGNKTKTRKARPKQKSYKRKVERSWTEEEILNLIKEVEMHPALWDFSCPEYKLPKDAVWQDVANILSASMDDCKGKWGNLRTTFNYNLAKYRKKKSGQGSDEIVTVSWKFFKSMMFLEASKVSQSTQSTSSLQLVILFLCFGSVLNASM